MIYYVSQQTYNALCSMANVCKNDPSLDHLLILQQACVGNGDDTMCVVIEDDCFVQRTEQKKEDKDK